MPYICILKWQTWKTLETSCPLLIPVTSKIINGEAGRGAFLSDTEYYVKDSFNLGFLLFSPRIRPLVLGTINTDHRMLPVQSPGGLIKRGHVVRPQST